METLCRVVVLFAICGSIGVLVGLAYVIIRDF